MKISKTFEKFINQNQNHIQNVSFEKKVLSRSDITDIQDFQSQL